MNGTLKMLQRISSLFKAVNQKNFDTKGFERWFKPYNMFARIQNDSLANNETIFSAVNRLSNSLATLPIKIYKEFSPYNSSIADMMANGPNSNMTSFEFIRTMEAYRNTSGNAYALKKYDYRFQVEGIYILDPAKVKPVIEKESQELYYEIQAEIGTYYVHNLDMIHVKHVHTSGYEGLSPLKVLNNTIDYDRQVKQFSLDQMESGIKASFVLKVTANMDPDKKQAMLEMFNSFYSQSGSGVIVLDGNQELKEIRQDVIDTKLFEVERITRTRVASVYNMPVSMLGETEGVNYNSMEQMALEFVQWTMLPIVRMYEQEFNRKLLTNEERQSGLYFKFNLGALLRGDTAARGEFYFKGIRSGWFKPNEVRRFEELPPEAGGDVLLVSRDLVPIAMAGKEVKPN